MTEYRHLLAITLVATSLLSTPAVEAKTPRSAAAVLAFKRANPCPSTGLPRGKCPGHVVDHIEPLCARGLDRPVNMQWQTVAEAKAKDRLERHRCRAGAQAKVTPW